MKVAKTAIIYYFHEMEEIHRLSTDIVIVM